MTTLAREGNIDPVTGREHEIRTMTDILLRRRQNNPLLTGEAGAGKRQWWKDSRWRLPGGSAAFTT